ncbi:hypothetical protein SPRG_13084 [Saprolegnia parasitica CBS 223.65]|uniref:Uncharacterized protein n=1 Tax=Saprolegnia parasitica (strain CBS 223.65) TaxID=695850 RepID=A0A067C5S4_SAPPC|nr:hypothetical protein SPRG_13084 [Saprolegnia parasitica CBS 223.65]KDO21901.1 hypothetical protein SPRG_13084 [Saprolegnia parasitica CBS 223.65]|eukprot:XP_012207347.1 hypothetical protein SPRG_13084 [Saprolegnia parasitica CBS 223.65]
MYTAIGQQDEDRGDEPSTTQQRTVERRVGLLQWPSGTRRLRLPGRVFDELVPGHASSRPEQVRVVHNETHEGVATIAAMQEIPIEEMVDTDTSVFGV